MCSGRNYAGSCDPRVHFLQAATVCGLRVLPLTPFVRSDLLVISEPFLPLQIDTHVFRGWVPAVKSTHMSSGLGLKGYFPGTAAHVRVVADCRDVCLV